MSNLPSEIPELRYLIACHRDQRAYGRLFIHLYKPMTRFAFSLVKSKEGAEEVYADVMVKLWDLGGALMDIGNLEVYLFVAVRNASLNYLSKYHKISTVDIDRIDADLLPAQRSGEDVFLEGELRQAMAAAIAALPTKCQLVYQLVKGHGLSYRQVAEIVGISVNTVEGHMATALKKVAHSLNTYLKAGGR